MAEPRASAQLSQVLAPPPATSLPKPPSPPIDIHDNYTQRPEQNRHTGAMEDSLGEERSVKRQKIASEDGGDFNLHTFLQKGLFEASSSEVLIYAAAHFS